MSNLLDEVQKHRKEIKHESLSFSLSELVNMYRAEPKEIQVNPEFQRLYRWSREQQSAFIESLILEIPIPPLFFYETDEGKWELLDGLQRFSTVVKFISTKHDVPIDFQGQAGNENDWHDQTQNDIDEPLQLLKGEYLTQLEGLSFTRLPVQLQLNLKRSRLHVIVLKRETHRTYKYEVFKRLNTGGSKLEEQEIRNCSVRLLGDKFPNYLQKLASKPDFRDSMNVSGETARNGFLEEMVLRYLTMKNYAANFKHDVANLLTKYMEEVAKEAIAFDYDGEEQLFDKTWALIKAAIPPGEAFQSKARDGVAGWKNVGPFSPTIYEMISVGVAKNHVALASSPGQVKERIFSLILKAKEGGLTGSGTNSRLKTRGRLELAIRELA